MTHEVPVGDMDKFLEIVDPLSLASFRLARFQSPTLQAIAVAQQQSHSSAAHSGARLRHVRRGQGAVRAAVAVLHAARRYGALITKGRLRETL